MMDRKGIFGNWIVRNIIWAVVFVACFVIAASIFLALVTQHSRTVTVPDFSNMTYEEAAKAASSAGINVEVGDSVFVKRMKKGVVYSQNPKAGSEVKRGRKVMLTTNAFLAKKVTMPDLVGLSMRQAKAELASKGLPLRRLIYVSDIATNNVLKQLSQNREISAGVSVESGTPIDLVVGLDSTEVSTFVPDLKGMKYLRSIDVIQENSLNVGSTVFDESVKNYGDSLDAVVYRQGPGAQTPANKGDAVSIFLTVDKSKLD